MDLKRFDAYVFRIIKTKRRRNLSLAKITLEPVRFRT